MKYKDFFSHLLTESMTMTIEDANYGHKAVENGLALSFRFAHLVVGPIIDKMTPEDKKYFEQNRAIEILTSDGDDYDTPAGIMNFYTAGFNPEAVQKIVDGIKYHATELGVEIGSVRGPEKSGMYKSPVIRIPIKTNFNVNNKVKPPEINLSNGNMYLIMYNILQLHEYGDDGLTIPAVDLLLRVNEILKQVESDDEFLYRYSNPTTTDQEPGKATMIHGGISPEYLKTRLDQIKALAEFAVERNYHNISIS